MPWEADGRRWHTAERITSEGKPIRWEGAILDWIDDEIHKLGDFAETNWKHRSTVEIAAPVRSQGWFLHAMTGQEWLLRLVFRVGRNTFKQGELVERLGIKPVNETPGLEIYSNEQRVWVTNHKGPWQSVTVLAHRLEEVNTPAFRAFLADAAKAFQGAIKRAQTKPEDEMPWKVNGERWHLGDKGFPAGRKLLWDRELLPRLLAVVREVEPGLEVSWDARDAITLRVPGVTRGWAQWRTKDSESLDGRFLGKKGQFNLSQLEGVGPPAELNGQRSEGEVLHLSFQRLEQLRPDRLKELLAQHLRGFREAFGKEK
jgi:excinuclease ABC subunit A